MMLLITLLSRFRGMTLGLALVLGLVLSTPLLPVPVSHAAEDFQAPSPTDILDPCGTSGDMLSIPGDFIHPISGFGGYYINGVPSSQGTHSMSKFDSVTVTASYNSGSWTYSFTNDGICPPQAVDTVGFDVVEGTCVPSQGLTQVNLWWTNIADSSALPKDAPSVYLTQVAKDSTSGSMIIAAPAELAADGQVVNYAVQYPGSFKAPGLYPGTWKATFTRNDGSAISTSFFVPSPCGGYALSPGDPASNDPTGPNVPTPGQSSRPKGSVKQVNGKARVKVIAINKNVRSVTKFLLVKNPRIGKTTTKKFAKLAPNANKFKRVLRADVGDRFVLRAEVFRTNGQKVMKVVARGGIKSLGS